MEKPLVIAHRGDSSRALENSLEAFRFALSIPVDMIEFDLRKSRDGRLYVMHDKDTGRTAEKNIDVEQSQSAVIDLVKLRNNEPIPAFADVLLLTAGKVGLNIEIKSKGAGALCAAWLADSGYKGRVLISSFQEREVLEARAVLPQMPIAGIFDTFVVADLKRYKSMGCAVISLRKKTVTKELIAACHEQNVKVYAWTVDEEAEAERLLGWGVDGMYSNDPRLVKRVVDAHVIAERD